MSLLNKKIVTRSSTKPISRKVFAIALAIITLTTILSVTYLVSKPKPAAAAAPPPLGDYIVLAWADQGMSFYNRDFADLAFLPPYVTLRAQVIRRGGAPQVVTQGITVEYSYPKNTSSVNKTNFWTYVQQIFGVNPAADVGLTGKGLSGPMTLTGDHFVATGIPLTEYDDTVAANPATFLKWKRAPYQLATVIVRDAGGNELVRTTPVTAVSTEVNCSKCHSDKGVVAKQFPFAKTGKTETNILTLHDNFNGTNLMGTRPVHCYNCHASNAPGGKAGQAGIPNFANAVHRRHANVAGMTQDTKGCYNCHPGPKTKGLRDIMSSKFAFQCTNCHGTMTQLAQKANPWVDEPRCDSCHANRAMDNASFAQSKGVHRGQRLIYCAGCHDSAHAIAPSKQKNDTLKFMAMTKTKGQLGANNTCYVCHIDNRTGVVH